MAYRRSSTALHAAGLNINDLRSSIKLDIIASNELDAKISLFRQDARTGKNPSLAKLDEMEATNKDMTKDVVRNIEKIESQGEPSKLTTTDREVLQALHARLATCDQQGMRLTELRDLVKEMEKRERKEAPLPLGGKPRTPENSPSPRKVTESLRGGPPDVRGRTVPVGGGPVLERVGSREVPGPMRGVPDVGGRPVSATSPVLERVGSRDLPGPPPVDPRRSSEVNRGPGYIPTTTPSPRIDEYASSSFPRRGSKVYSTNDFAGIQSPRKSSDSFFSPKAPAVSFPPPPRRSESIKMFPNDLPPSPRMPPSPRLPPSPRRSSSSITGTPSPKRSPRIDTPQGEQLKYDDFYHVNRVDEVSNEPDKTTWPILYRIVDIDPATDPRVWDAALKRSLARLSLKHDPARLPNDPDAPLRWAVVCKAYDVLSDPERRRLYDVSGLEPRGFEELDFARLRIV